MRIEDFTMDIHGSIFEMSKVVLLHGLYWKSEHLHTQNARSRFAKLILKTTL